MKHKQPIQETQILFGHVQLIDNLNKDFEKWKWCTVDGKNPYEQAYVLRTFLIHCKHVGSQLLSANDVMCFGWKVETSISLIQHN